MDKHRDCALSVNKRKNANKQILLYIGVKYVNPVDSSTLTHLQQSIPATKIFSCRDALCL